MELAIQDCDSPNMRRFETADFSDSMVIKGDNGVQAKQETQGSEIRKFKSTQFLKEAHTIDPASSPNLATPEQRVNLKQEAENSTAQGHSSGGGLFPPISNSRRPNLKGGGTHLQF